MLLRLAFDYWLVEQVTTAIDPAPGGGEHELAVVVAEREWRLLCEHYQVLREVKRLIAVMEYRRLDWWLGCYRLYCEAPLPVPESKEAEYERLAAEGVAWMAGELDYVPEFRGLPHTAGQLGRAARDLYVVSLKQRGVSCAEIAERVELSASRVDQIWHAHLDRCGRPVSAVGS
jgi:hypothetical protein